MGAVATIRATGLASNPVDDVRSALVAEIVAGEIVGRVTAGSWRALGTRHEASTALLRLAAIELHELGLLTVDDSGLRISEHESWRLFAPAVFRELDQPRGRQVIASYMDARRLVDTDLSSLAARRRGLRDVLELARLLSSFSSAATASAQPHVRFQNYRAVDERLRRTIARASRNRHLAAVSGRLRSRIEEAEWITKRALSCRVSSSVVTALIDAVRCGNVEQAAAAAQAEIDLIESWVWQMLSGPGRR
jgi:DNA-binding FadR family transcriptional regulator